MNSPKPTLNYFGNRDFNLAFIELYLMFENAPHEWQDGRVAPGEYSIAEYRDGLMQVYFDLSSLEWIKAEVFKKLEKDRSLAQKIIDTSWRYEKPYSDLLKNPQALDQKELVSFIEYLRPLWSWMVAMWWLIEALENNPKYEKEFNELMELRKSLDYFAPHINAVIAKTAKSMYPEYQEYFNLISIHEMEKHSKISLETLKKRKEALFIDLEGIYAGEEAEKRRNKYTLIKPTASGEKEVKGQVTFKGKYKGRVMIVLSDEDAKNVKDGDVMIASQTIPNWVFAMKKAGAIVTDEGGLLSHAAILSRELKIPCVIGTKLATQVFKNGQTVEVDAEKGIVKII